GGRNFGDRLLAGIDEIRILLAFIRERAESEHAVLALQLHADTLRDVVRNQRGNANTEIDVKSVAQLLAARSAICSRVQAITLPLQFLPARWRACARFAARCA